MNPHTRTAFALGGSLLIWSPVAISVLNGGTELSTGGLYYLLALVFAYIGTGVISMIMDSYKRSAMEVERAKRQIELLERRAAATERRRVDDKNAADIKAKRSGDKEFPPLP